MGTEMEDYVMLGIPISADGTPLPRLEEWKRKTAIWQPPLRGAPGTYTSEEQKSDEYYEYLRGAAPGLEIEKGKLEELMGSLGHTMSEKEIQELQKCLELLQAEELFPGSISDADVDRCGLMKLKKRDIEEKAETLQTFIKEYNDAIEYTKKINEQDTNGLWTGDDLWTGGGYKRRKYTKKKSKRSYKKKKTKKRVKKSKKNKRKKKTRRNRY